MVLGVRTWFVLSAAACALLAAPPLRAQSSDQPSVQGSLASQKSVTPPKLVKSVEPEYPEAAREKRLEPSIVLALGIDEQGHVTHV